MKKLYTIKDLAVEAYGPLFEARAHGEAIRLFKDEATNSESRISKHPQDFELFYMGEFNDQNGEFNTPAPEKLARATDYKGE